MNARHDTSSSQTVLGLPFFAGSKADAVSYIKKKVDAGEFLTVATPNPEQIVQMNQDSEFKAALMEFDLYLPDGQGIVWASRLLGKPLHERIAGIDLLSELLRYMAEKNCFGFIVGGSGYENITSNLASSSVQTTDQLAVKQLSIQEASLFWYQDFDKASSDDQRQVMAWITQHRPVFVFVALGAPFQEEWIIQHREQLQKAGVQCVMVVGGAFDVLTGKLQRSPKLLQRVGLEWMWRLGQQPWRLGRQLRLLGFMVLVFSAVSKKRE